MTSLLNILKNLLEKETINDIASKLNVASGTVKRWVELENVPTAYTFELMPGVDQDGVSNEISNNPTLYLPKAIMRYSLIHAQLVNIVIPHNGRLTVGECIRLDIENITQDNKVEKELNEHRSGNYLIMHLCHAFTPNNSFTSLTLARDEYGVARRL